jgi:hypothetical protein
MISTRAMQYLLTCVYRMDYQRLDNFLSAYGRKYGYLAEDYARENFRNWSRGIIRIADQTKGRFLAIAPRYITSDEKMNLIKLIVEDNENNVQSRRRDSYSYSVYRHSYDNHRAHFRYNFADSEEAKQKTLQSIQKQFSEYAVIRPLSNLPQNLRSYATWLDDSGGKLMLYTLNSLHQERENQKIQIAYQKLQLALGRLGVDPVTFTVDIELPDGTIVLTTCNEKPSEFSLTKILFWAFIIYVVWRILIR